MASDRHSLRLAFVSPVPLRDTSAFVLLEQEAWDPYINYLTKAGVFAYLNARLFQAPAPPAFCSAADGSYSKTVFAYPSPAALPYQIGVAVGVISECSIAFLDYAEAIQCDLQAELTPKYPVQEITSYEWVGDAYDQNGAVIPRPAVRISGKALALSQPVYGTLLVVYKVIQHRYTVSITPRPGAKENRLTAFAWAVWNGGNTYLDVEAPSGAKGGVCQGSIDTGSAHMEEMPDGVPGSVSPDNETHYIDYCTMLEITS
ncbi:MAG: hypothetical protein WC869_15830 [Phycisphaerae bacterium]|jgi:hypothetical protein